MFEGQIIDEDPDHKIKRLEREKRELQLFVLAVCARQGGELEVPEIYIEAVENADWESSTQMDMLYLKITNIEHVKDVLGLPYTCHKCGKWVSQTQNKLCNKCFDLELEQRRLI